MLDLKAKGIIIEEEESHPDTSRSQTELFIPLRDQNTFINEADSEIDKTENLQIMVNPSTHQNRMFRSSTLNMSHSFNRENPLIDNNQENDLLDDSHRNLLNIPS